MAKKDAGSDEEEAIEAAEEEELPEHKNFVSAARKEHQSEAIALKEHREHESKEREVLMERLNLMRASVLWRDAPLLQATILTDNEVALGEDSTEKTRLAAVRHGIKPKMYIMPFRSTSEPRRTATRKLHTSSTARVTDQNSPLCGRGTSVAPEWKTKYVF
jgi:hypothetical protein